MVEVLILSTPGCPSCETVKRMLEKIKKDVTGLKVREIDLTQHPEIATKYRLMSAPGIVINGELEFVGVPNEDELRKKMKRGE